MEQREYDGMESLIFEKEAELEKLNAEMEDPANISMSAKLAELYTKVSEKQAEVDKLYSRWEELELKKAELEA